MRYEEVGQKSVRFVGVDTESQVQAKEVSLCAFRLNLHSSDQQAGTCHTKAACQGRFLAVLRALKA